MNTHALSATSQVISHDVSVVARYSDSTIDLATRDCFFVFHDMSELPRRTQNPLVDLLVVGHPAQSLSQYVVS